MKENQIMENGPLCETCCNHQANVNPWPWSKSLMFIYTIRLILPRCISPSSGSTCSNSSSPKSTKVGRNKMGPFYSGVKAQLYSHVRRNPQPTWTFIRFWGWFPRVKLVRPRKKWFLFTIILLLLLIIIIIIIPIKNLPFGELYEGVFPHWHREGIFGTGHACMCKSKISETSVFNSISWAEIRHRLFQGIASYGPVKCIV